MGSRPTRQEDTNVERRWIYLPRLGFPNFRGHDPKRGSRPTRGDSTRMCEKKTWNNLSRYEFPNWWVVTPGRGQGPRATHDNPTFPNLGVTTHEGLGRKSQNALPSFYLVVGFFFHSQRRDVKKGQGLKLGKIKRKGKRWRVRLLFARSPTRTWWSRPRWWCASTRCPTASMPATSPSRYLLLGSRNDNLNTQLQHQVLPSLKQFYLVFTGFYLVLHSFIMFNQILPSFTQFSRVLPSFHQFYQVEPSFTEFFSILPSFTEFYRGLPSATKINRV